MVLALGLGACGGSGGGSGGSADEVVAPATYVTSLCRTMVQWSEEAETAFAGMDLERDDDRPASLRRGFLSYFDPLQESTEEMVTRVEKLGRPDVADGAAVAGDLREELTTAAARLKANRNSWAAIPLSDVQPAASIEGALTVVQDQMRAVHDSVERLGRSPELRPVWDREPACTTFTEKRP